MTDEETRLMDQCDRLARAIYGNSVVVYLTRDGWKRWIAVLRTTDANHINSSSAHADAVYAIRELRTWLIGRAEYDSARRAETASEALSVARDLGRLAAEIAANQPEIGDYPQTTAAIDRATRCIRGLRAHEIAGDRLRVTLAVLARDAIAEATGTVLHGLEAPMQASLEAGIKASGMSVESQQAFLNAFAKAFVGATDGTAEELAAILGTEAPRVV